MTRLACGMAVVAVVWLGLLPRLIQLQPMAGHVERMEARGVNPAAMYYTELEQLPLRPAWIEQRVVLWP